VRPLVSSFATHAAPAVAAAHAQEASAARFNDAYRSCFAFVYRNVRRLGVASGSVDDVVQDVFLVVHRRFSDYDSNLPLRGWVYGILTRVVREHRRASRRRVRVIDPVDSTTIPPPPSAVASAPDRMAEKHQALRELSRLLEQLDEEKRETLVLAELEQMTAPEIAMALGLNLNTVYARLSAARRQFGEIYRRERARAAHRESQ
jgi:RNA polymerase sigma-70 factor (ECF subfamily)